MNRGLIYILFLIIAQIAYPKDLISLEDIWCIMNKWKNENPSYVCEINSIITESLFTKVLYTVSKSSTCPIIAKVTNSIFGNTVTYYLYVKNNESYVYFPTLTQTCKLLGKLDIKTFPYSIEKNTSNRKNLFSNYKIIRMNDENIQVILTWSNEAIEHLAKWNIASVKKNFITKFTITKNGQLISSSSNIRHRNEYSKFNYPIHTKKQVLEYRKSEFYDFKLTQEISPLSFNELYNLALFDSSRE